MCLYCVFSLWSSLKSSSTFFVFSTRTSMVGGRLPSPSLPSRYVCHDVYRWIDPVWIKIASVTISTLQSYCKVTCSLVFLISGCWQTLCPCRPEEGRHWPQQESWRADWGGGEKSVILTEEKLYTCQNITALVGFEGPSLNQLDHYIHSMSSHRWLYFDNGPDVCSSWIPVEWVVLM